MTYDVTIVGAGPSGAYAGFLLAKQGYKVLILDRDAFPRDKVCGGGISNKTVQLLDFDLSSVIQTRVSGAYLTYQNRHIVARDLEGRDGITTLRRDFDNLILEKAIGQGATFRPSTAFETLANCGDLVKLNTTTGSISTRYVFGADGVFSRVRQSCFPDKLVTYAPSVEALVYVDPAIVAKFNGRVLFDFGGMQRGYGWIFPKHNHLNVGVFSIYPSAANIKTALATFMSRYKSLAKFSQIRYLGFCIPLANTRGIYQQRNVWLLGDAAGFAESFYGEGIYFALKSAASAASSLHESFDSPGSVLYTDRVKKELATDLKYSELNAKVFFNMPEFGYYRMVRNEYVNYYFAELIGGNVSHRECFYKTIFSAPYWLLAKKIDYVAGLEL